MLLRTELTTDLHCGSCLPLVFFAEPVLAIGLDVVGGGGGVDVPVVPAKLLVQLKRGFVCREVEQAIQRVLNLLRVAAAGMQDVVDRGLVLLRSLQLKVLHALGDGADRFKQRVGIAHD